MNMEIGLFFISRDPIFHADCPDFFPVGPLNRGIVSITVFVAVSITDTNCQVDL